MIILINLTLFLKKLAERLSDIFDLEAFESIVKEKQKI